MAKSNANKPVADALGVLLATSYTLALKTQAYHWNVVGEQFVQLHELFGEQYAELNAANDEIAERIRALGQVTPASFGEFAELSLIKSEGGQPKAAKMVEALRDGHAAAAKAARAVIEAAEKVGDDASADLATERIAAHDKAAWMLGALLG